MAADHVQRYGKDAPPDDDLAKVVGMPGHAPQPFRKLPNKSCTKLKFSLPLTIVAELALIGRILAERELLQIRVGLRQQTHDKHARARGVQRRHCLGSTRLRVAR